MIVVLIAVTRTLVLYGRRDKLRGEGGGIPTDAENPGMPSRAQPPAPVFPTFGPSPNTPYGPPSPSEYPNEYANDQYPNEKIHMREVNSGQMSEPMAGGASLVPSVYPTVVSNLHPGYPPSVSEYSGYKN